MGERFPSKDQPNIQRKIGDPRYIKNDEERVEAKKKITLRTWMGLGRSGYHSKGIWKRCLNASISQQPLRKFRAVKER